MIKDTDKKKEAMTRIEMRISKEDKAIIEQKKDRSYHIGVYQEKCSWKTSSVLWRYHTFTGIFYAAW